MSFHNFVAPRIVPLQIMCYCWKPNYSYALLSETCRLLLVTASNVTGRKVVILRDYSLFLLFFILSLVLINHTTNGTCLLNPIGTVASNRFGMIGYTNELY